MEWRICSHRVKKGDVVDHRSDIREQIADILSAFTVLLEVPLRSNHTPLFSMTPATKSRDLDFLTIEWVEFWFVIKSVDVTGATVHEQEDHRFGPRRNHRSFRCHRIQELRGAVCSQTLTGEEAVAEHAAQGQGGESSSCFPQEFPASSTAEVSSIFGTLAIFHVIAPSIDVDELVQIKCHQAEDIESLFFIEIVL